MVTPLAGWVQVWCIGLPRSLIAGPNPLAIRWAAISSYRCSVNTPMEKPMSRSRVPVASACGRSMSGSRAGTRPPTSTRSSM